MGEMVAFGKYRVTKKRGAKGSWIVYDAVEVSQERKVELRVYSNRLAEGGQKAKRFLDTLMRISELDHPHVVSILDLGVVMEKGFYTVPPRDAAPIGEALAARELAILDELERLEVARDLGAGLQALHDAGLVHGAICPESVAWDRRRCRAYLSWIPVLERGPDEFRFELKRLPKAYEGEAADLARLAAIAHHVAVGVGPLTDTEAAGDTMAINVPGSIDGVYEVFSRALALDPSEAFPSTGDFLHTLEKTLAKQRVRAELEKSVSSMTIPQEVLEAALKKKKEQKRRRLAADGATAAEAPYVGLFERVDPRVLAGLGCAAVVGMGFFLVGSEPPGAAPRPRAATATPGQSRRPVRAPRAPRRTNRRRAPKKIRDEILALREAPSTTNESFSERWATLKRWTLRITPAQRRDSFTFSTLVGVRTDFHNDEFGACRKLDDLIKLAVRTAE